MFKVFNVPKRLAILAAIGVFWLFAGSLAGQAVPRPIPNSPAIAYISLDSEHQDVLFVEGEGFQFDSLKWPAVKHLEKIGSLKGVAASESRRSLFLSNQQYKSGPEGSFRVIGMDHTDFSFFRLGMVEMSYGRMFRSEEFGLESFSPIPVIISQGLANANGWGVVSRFTLDQLVHSLEGEGEEIQVIGSASAEFQVIGIFEVNRLLEVPPSTGYFDSAMFVPANAVKKLKDSERELIFHHHEENHKKAGWWRDYKKSDAVFRPRGLSPFDYYFIMEEDADLAKFESRANKILPDGFEIRWAGSPTHLL